MAGQERPGWCPHTDCRFKRLSDNACVGHLPEPSIEHRICFAGVLPDPDEVFELMVDDSDLRDLRWLLEGLKE